MEKEYIILSTLSFTILINCWHDLMLTFISSGNILANRLLMRYDPFNTEHQLLLYEPAKRSSLRDRKDKITPLDFHKTLFSMISVQI